jgi:hypothetical protein
MEAGVPRRPCGDVWTPADRHYAKPRPGRMQGLRQLAGNNLSAALWPVSDRATTPTEGLQDHEIISCELPYGTRRRFACSLGGTGGSDRARESRSTFNNSSDREKGDRSILCTAPYGPFRQIGPVPFFSPGLPPDPGQRQQREGDERRQKKAVEQLQALRHSR